MKRSMGSINYKVIAAKNGDFKNAALIKDLETVKKGLDEIKSQQAKYDVWFNKGVEITKEEKAIADELEATVRSFNKVQALCKRLAPSLCDFKNPPTDSLKKEALERINSASKIGKYLSVKVISIVTKFADLNDALNQFENFELDDRLDLYEAIIAFYDLVSPKDPALANYKHKADILRKEFESDSDEEDEVPAPVKKEMGSEVEEINSEEPKLVLPPALVASLRNLTSQQGQFRCIRAKRLKHHIQKIQTNMKKLDFAIKTFNENSEKEEIVNNPFTDFYRSSVEMRVRFDALVHEVNLFRTENLKRLKNKLRIDFNETKKTPIYRALLKGLKKNDRQNEGDKKKLTKHEYGLYTASMKVCTVYQTIPTFLSLITKTTIEGIILQKLLRVKKK